MAAKQCPQCSGPHSIERCPDLNHNPRREDYVTWWKVGSEGVTVERFDAAPHVVPLDRDFVRWFRRESDAVAYVRTNLERSVDLARSSLARAERLLATFLADHAGV